MSSQPRAARLGAWVAWTVAALCVPTSTRAAPAAGTAPFALVELFTSEGCSSCPPADALALRLEQEAERDGRRVFVIGYHVDYWDRLGWVDRWAEPEHTARQRRYAKHLAGGRTYTPQVVINGAWEAVGSDEAAVRKQIAGVLAAPARVAFDGGVARTAPREVSVEATVGERKGAADLYFALVRRGLATEVKAGENAGRTLRHVGAARSLTRQPIPAGGAGRVTGRVSLPVDFAEADLQIVAWLQDRKTMAVLGAGSWPLPAPAAPVAPTTP